MSRLEIRRRCREFAEKYYRIQREQFQRLGVLGDWDNPYLTMSPDYEASDHPDVPPARRARLHLSRPAAGALVRRSAPRRSPKPRSSTATTPRRRSTCAFRSPLQRRRGGAHWRASPATPTTSAARAAGTSGGGDLDDHAVDAARQSGGVLQPDARLRRHRSSATSYLIVAPRLADAFLAATGLAAKERRRIAGGPVVARRSRCVPPSALRPHRRAPCSRRTSPPTPAPAACTPRRATATRTSRSDRSTACRCSRRSTPRAASPPKRVPTPAARCSSANDAIVDDLRANGRLVHSEKLSHSYPHCWRCKNPLIFRATEQWFLRIDHAGLRENALAEIDRVGWVPTLGTRPHPQHDADASRLVPVAPARLGRADSRPSRATAAARSTPIRR